MRRRWPLVLAAGRHAREGCYVICAQKFSKRQPYGLSEMLVVPTTSMANNGQNIAGLSANTPFYNVTIALLAIGTVQVVGALIYMPVLGLGSVVEQLMLG